MQLVLTALAQTAAVAGDRCPHARDPDGQVLPGVRILSSGTAAHLCLVLADQLVVVVNELGVSLLQVVMRLLRLQGTKHNQSVHKPLNTRNTAWVATGLHERARRPPPPPLASHLFELGVALREVAADLFQHHFTMLETVLGLFVRLLQGRLFPGCLGLQRAHGVAKLGQLQSTV